MLSLHESVAMVRAITSEAADSFAMFARTDDAIVAIAKAALVISECIRNSGKILTCGNGGSMSDAIHLAEEMTGRFRSDRPPMPAIALSDPGHLTCTGNDYGFEYVFSRLVNALGREGDVLVAFSTSGRSPNVLNAAQAANEHNMRVISLTGRPASELEALSDLTICANTGQWPDRAQEIHTLVLHSLIQLVEYSVFPSKLDAGDE